MAFARKVWHLLVAIKDGLALLFLLLFFAALYMLLTMAPGPAAIRTGALLLKLDGAVVEEPHIADPLSGLLSAQAPTAEYRARDIIDALRAAAKDDRIKVVVMDLSGFTGGGQVHMQEIGKALDQVRAAKKPVLTYAALYADDALLLAAHSSEIWVDPMGGAFILGPGGNHLYYAKLLEKLKVDAHIFRVGTYKSAVEPYMRNDMSDASREASQALYGSLWDQWKADVALARPKADIALATGDPAAGLKASAGDPPKAALAAGLVDRIGDEVAFGNRVAEIVGDGGDQRPGSFAHNSLRAWLSANPQPKPGKAVGVITIAGEIVDGDAGPGTAGGDRIADLLDKGLAKDFAALVVRVDSPGGSIFASEQIRTAINRYKAKGVPIVVSMSNLAASGGYWVSTPASRIFAEPSTITGSIGVFAIVPTFERALGDWGVTTDGVKTTPLSGQPDLFGGLNPQISAMLQSNVENSYAKFIGLVGRSRSKTPEQVDAIGQGRVWPGGEARQLGLVDQFGGLDDALAFAAGAAKLKDGEWHAEFIGANPNPLSALLEKLRSDDDSAPPASARDWTGLVALRQSQGVGQALLGAERLLGRSGSQAYCLECPQPAPAVRVSASGFARISALLRGLGR